MSRRLYVRSKPEKSALSFADIQHEVTKSVEDNTSKSYRNHQKQANLSRASEEDELVKYMSNLPGYLERGENFHEKVLNVGVLDWARLEKWQLRHKHKPHRGSRGSTSTSNTPSSVSTEGLSGHSSRGHSWSPSCQRICRPSLQSFFMASTVQGYSQDVKSSGENVGTCQNLKGNHGNINAQSKFVRADEHLCQNLPVSRLKACNRKDLDPNIDMESLILPSDQTYDEASCAKLEMGTQDSKLEKRVETLQEPNINTVDQGVLRKSKPVQLLLPTDIPRNGHLGVSYTRTSLGEKLGNSGRTSFSERSKELFLKDLNSDISHSCTLPHEVKANHTHAKGSSFLDAKGSRIPSATLSAPLSTKIGMSPSISGKADERKHTIATISSSNRPSQGLDQKVKSEKSRSSSPFYRFSISVDVPHRSSIPAVKSSSENVRGSASSYISGNDNLVDAGRSRSSPLRRLLHPLLKPKEANCHHSLGSSQKDSINKNCKSANVKFSHLHPEKELDRDHRVSCSSINTYDSSKDKKLVSSTVRAHLRIAVKNGLPLFTFAVDNDSNILAATMKNFSTSRKDDCSCIYTFFTFREVKKKNGSWMNQSSKSRGPNYIHHVVAQMKVSNSHMYDLTDQNCVESCTVKEFVLLSVELRQEDGQVTDYQPNDELAAMVIKIPKAFSFINDVHQSRFRNDNQQLVHATVVLPSGVHSLPSKGGPPSLIERWKSGGSCDCGGWDLGCKLKILVNENQASKISKPSEAFFAEQFELFFQGSGQEDHLPAFCLTPFKHGICSIAFDSSLSHLQAFSICIALMDNRMPYELSGSRKSVEGKFPRETLSMQSDGIKVLSKLENLPASYVSYPPLSPVGRV